MYFFASLTAGPSTSVCNTGIHRALIFLVWLQGRTAVDSDSDAVIMVTESRHLFSYTTLCVTERRETSNTELDYAYLFIVRLQGRTAVGSDSDAVIRR